MPKENPENAAKRQSAAYITEANRLHRADDGKSEEEIDRLALQAADHAVFGFDAKRDKKGKFMQQGIGAPGHETANHFNAIKKYEGKDAWEAAVREIYKRDPAHAARLGLPKLAEKAA